MNRKASTEAAVHNFIKKESGLENNKGPQRRNKTPERDTEKAVLRWAKTNHIYLHVVESSSYDPLLGMKGSSKASAGFSDLVGNTPTGLACYIELKALGRRRNVSELQRLFLEKKINQGCFAVVVDSVDVLQEFFGIFCSLKTPPERKEYLKSVLPNPQRRDKPARDDFEEQWGF